MAMGTGTGHAKEFAILSLRQRWHCWRSAYILDTLLSRIHQP
jgi:hypothetical protein